MEKTILTVQDLIDRLQKIENKQLPIKVFNDSYTEISIGESMYIRDIDVFDNHTVDINI